MTRAKKGSSPTPQPEQAVAPLMGALRQEGEQDETSTLLQMVLQQMAASEQERRLEMAALQQAVHTSQEAFVQATAEFQHQLAVIKRENAEAIDAVRAQFQKLIEAKPVDRSTWQKMYKTAMQEAQAQIAANHVKFMEDLKTMPTGTVINDEEQAVAFIINGVTRIFKPGKNTKVPKVFIEEWRKRKDLRLWAAGIDKSLQATGGNQSANDLAATLGHGPVWDENVGRL